MTFLGKWQWLALCAAIALIVLLYFAPHHSDKIVAADEEKAPVTTENRIDSALALVNSDQPMAGILLLRSIAEEEPDNFRAQYHMGLFSMQTAQWDKAIERFEKTLSLNPSVIEAHFHLGKAYFEAGQPMKSSEQLEIFIQSSEGAENSLTDEAKQILSQIKH